MMRVWLHSRFMNKLIRREERVAPAGSYKASIFNITIGLHLKYKLREKRMRGMNHYEMRPSHVKCDSDRQHANIGPRKHSCAWIGSPADQEFASPAETS